MKNNNRIVWSNSLVALIGLLCAASWAAAQDRQERTMIPKEKVEAARRSAPAGPNQVVLGCTGPITQVIDVAYEDLKVTSAVFGTSPGGGEGGQFDKLPVLSTTVTLKKNACLNAHLSAIVGSRQTYGSFLSSLTLFQVTLTPPGGGPRHMVGHYPTPYGVTPPSPAVASEAERDVDMLAANFFQKVGTGPSEVPPGTYRVDVWWAGAPPGSGSPGGALAMDFVLKLYLK